MKWVISLDDIKQMPPITGTINGTPPTLSPGQLLLQGSSILDQILQSQNFVKQKAPKIKPKGGKSTNQTRSLNPIKTGIPQFDECFVLYPSQQAINKVLPIKYHPWVTYILENGYDDRLQKDYMIFCGGWLQYWDLNVSTEIQPRSVYFVWGEGGKSVSIFLSNQTRRQAYRVTILIEPPIGETDPPKLPPPPPPSA